MIAVSRKRGYKADRAVATAVVRTKSRTSTSGNSSHVQCGPTPAATTKTSTTARFTPRLKRLVTTTARGMTRRGNWLLRTTDSWLTMDGTACDVASWKNEKRTMLNSSSTG